MLKLDPLSLGAAVKSGQNDRKQAFADVVTLEAWHRGFATESRSADLHVDVVFGVGRLGEEASSPVRFKLEMKRAELVVVVPQMEPVAVDPTSVSRDAPQLNGKMTSSQEKKRNLSIGAKFLGKIGFKKPAGEANIELSGGTAFQRTDRLELSGPAEMFAVTQSRTADGHYRWILTPKLGDILEGRPWEAATAPRMTLMDGRTVGSSSLEPVVRAEISCRREDIVISELVLKDDSLWASMGAKAGFRNRMAAAESYIRDQLLGDGLDVGEMAELYSRMTIASVVAITLPGA